MEDRRRSEDTRIDVLTERVENWMETTTEYRKSLCTKIDKISERLDHLPCPARQEITKNIHTQLRALWVIISAIFFGIIAEWIKLK